MACLSFQQLGQKTPVAAILTLVIIKAKVLLQSKHLRPIPIGISTFRYFVTPQNDRIDQSEHIFGNCYSPLKLSIHL
jgi:hypothetical protein